MDTHSAHDSAIAQAYLLIEVAQSDHDAARVEAADREAAAHGWDDVRFLLHWTRSLDCLEKDTDDTVHVDAMADTAARIGDPALLALVAAVRAARQGRRRHLTAIGQSTSAFLVEAIVQLDENDPPSLVPHRAAAMIEVGVVAHDLGFWELALEFYERTERELGTDHAAPWSNTTSLQARVVVINKDDLILDWACRLATLGDWAEAAARARTALGGGDPTGPGWPASWIEQFHAARALLCALSGEPGPDVEDGFGAMSSAIRAARAGDARRAADLAEASDEQSWPYTAIGAHLLRLCLMAKRPGTNPAAIRYADEMSVLRWNDRIDRLAGVRDAIAGSRRRREHEKLRRDLVIDELTGLANRRGYQAYLAAVDGPEEAGDYAVMMIDVDHFKAVNDGFGHDIGDVVLARLGHILAAHVRQIDLAARLGGDEFVVILAEVQPGVATVRAQQILDAVRSHPWHDTAEGLAVSVSIGVHHGSRRELPTLLTDADRGLYQAKHEGRGQVATVS
ncbi:GGDEF domain-containing protein [Actinoplanes derwentensis]|uniref:Diguanylate cyclase (GGDEF) domain-containing protein n=1 Tax=Actinoplanes derwentensis TaxID=113562 RepID=A0A1H1TGG9_9ACTN|nr:GGDEF domain-containing protein [Actinoplanes derwentensis]GID85018.1 hypothetical protein Ade03nite_39420 [Actinoplanes derwentensis]SDS59056.1 diguanylate cyclase (GGDEF) domain-containing protein [Actinoplanes derwentensis]